MLFLIFLYGAMATAWNLLGGLAGQISFGHAAFLGIGAYATTVLLANGTPLAVAVVVSALLAGAYSLLIGVPAFRLRGPYFSIATIGIGEATRLIALNWNSLTGGASGLTLSSAPPLRTQYFAALLLLAGRGRDRRVDQSVALRVRAGRGPAGYRRRRNARRRDDVREDASAVHLRLHPRRRGERLRGALSVHQPGLRVRLLDLDRVRHHADHRRLGTVAGPLIGAVVYTFIREQFAATLGNADLLAFGVLLIAIVVFEPKGILGIVDRIRRASSPARAGGAATGGEFRWLTSCCPARGSANVSAAWSRCATSTSRSSAARSRFDRPQRRRQVDAVSFDRRNPAADDRSGAAQRPRVDRPAGPRRVRGGDRGDPSDRASVSRAERDRERHDRRVLRSPSPSARTAAAREAALEALAACGLAERAESPASALNLAGAKAARDRARAGDAAGGAAARRGPGRVEPDRDRPNAAPGAHDSRPRYDDRDGRAQLARGARGLLAHRRVGRRPQDRRRRPGDACWPTNGSSPRTWEPPRHA